MPNLDRGRPGEMIVAAVSLLRPEDLGLALEEMGSGELRRLCELLGAAPLPANVAPERVWAALHTVPDENAVEIAALFVDPLFGGLLAAAICDDWPSDPSPADARGSVRRVMAFLDAVSPLLKKPTLEELEAVRLFAYDAQDPSSELSAVGGDLTEQIRSHPPTLASDLPIHLGPPFCLAELVLSACGRPVSALDRTLLATVRAARIGAARSPPLDDVRHAGLELLRLDPARESSWYVLGFALGDADAAASFPAPLPPATAEHRYYFLLGRVCAALERGEPAEVVRAAVTDREATRRLMGAPEGAGLARSVLLAAIARRPALVAELLDLVPQPFGGWPELFAELRAVVARSIETDHERTTTEVLLRAADGRIGAWSASTRRHSAETGPDPLAAERAELAVLRAARHRRMRDFGGARQLLHEVELANLSGEGAARAAWERALAEAEIASLAEVAVPQCAQARAQWGARLEAVRPWLEAALDADPGWASARLLLAVDAVARGDDEAAARELRLAEPYLADLPETVSSVVSALCCHLALSELATAPPDGEAQAWGWVVEAYLAGHEPPVEALVATCRALHDRRSARSSELLTWAVDRAADDDRVEALVIELALDGDVRAIELAERLARDDGRRPSSRVVLLRAALTGFAKRGDKDAVSRVVETVDQLLARVALPDLDDDWAQVLATDDVVRFAIGAERADCMRADLVRAGRAEQTEGARTARQA